MVWIFVGLAWAQTPGPTVLWQPWAKKLIGEKEEIRKKSIVELKRIKDLNPLLKAALATDERALALDVIVALQLHSFQGPLLQEVTKDKDGIIVLALNALLNSENRLEIAQEYVQHLRLRLNLISPSAAVAMIDGLGRIGKKLPSEMWLKLFTHPMHEVRSTALTYLRVMHFNHRLRPAAEFLRLGLKEPAFQLKMQTAFFVHELRNHPAYKSILAYCLKEGDKDVRLACEGPPPKKSSRKSASEDG